MKIRKLRLKNIGVFDDEEINFQECDFNKGKEIKDRKQDKGHFVSILIQIILF